MNPQYEEQILKNADKMMLNKFESYQHSLGAISAPHISPAACSNSSSSCSADFADAAAAKAERESIHSGQFMVSHFEAEEAQDDLDDGEVKMLDPEDPSLSKPDEPNPCLEVQLYVPHKVTNTRRESGQSSISMVTSHLEIETSLTKLFKCMNLAYSQKLTSPKWNHFKGVRLRWKDKIRLNNVIWRCWHMQFILKRRTPVCQFASPLDVDIHSNPQTVVLEGKYWKRQLAVIKAEYRKWRKNYKSKATGCLTYDTKSEFDFLEWSPLNDKSLMLTDDWTSDTLFSAINGPFPFPDPREIARGAGIADFIQPSLGPLQPNLDDIEITFADLLQTTRLPSVPEEGTDDILKNVDYGFSAIMNSEQMDSSNMMDVAQSNNIVVDTNDDANMIELNTPISNVQFSDIEQQFGAAVRSNGCGVRRVNNNTQVTLNTPGGGGTSATILSEVVQRPAASIHSLTNDSSTNLGGGRQSTFDFSGKSVINGRISKSSQRPFRREPHNYDKAQPTLHQTTIYQQMLAEQQNIHHHQHLQSNISNAQLQHQSPTFQSHQHRHFPTQTSQQQYLTSNSSFNGAEECAASGPVRGYINKPNDDSLIESFLGNMTTNINTATESKSFSNIQQPQQSNILAASVSSNAQQQQQIKLNVKVEPNSSDMLSILNMASATATTSTVPNLDAYANAVNNSNSNSYKPYPNLAHFKKSASTGTFINVPRMTVNINQNYIQDQHSQQQLSSTTTQPFINQHFLQLQQQTQSTSSHHQQQLKQPLLSTANTTNMVPKEMFRSNSLPLNVSLQKLDARLALDQFAVPKYHPKSSKSRVRSNSMHQHMAVTTTNNNTNINLRVSQQLQQASSDPLLNSTLAQLLTTRNTIKQESSSTSAISSMNLPMSKVQQSNTKSQKCADNVPQSGSFISPSPSSTLLHMIRSTNSGVTLTSSEFSQRQQPPNKILNQHQQKPSNKSASLPAPISSTISHNHPTNKVLSYPLAADQVAVVSVSNTSTHLKLSPESFHEHEVSPLSPTSNSLKFPRDSQRRVGHIHAEQKRRYNIKNGFDMLHSLIPQLQQNPNAKLSKAAMLQKGADHIKHLRTERNVLEDKMETMRMERDALNNSLTHLHSILPANGAPVTRQGTEHVRQLFEQYVRYRTMNNWKFWILGLILEPLLASYTSSVSSASMEELRRTAFLWVDQHCSLIDLRPAVSNKLKYLSMMTDILSDPPSTLQEEVAKALQNTAGQHPNLHST